MLKSRNYNLSKERLEMFSDGVFAIAITLLVLEIKVPKHEQLEHYGGLYNYLMHIWPQYLAYAVSFLALGVYWSNHHWMFSFIKHTNHVFNMLNLVFLMTVCFMPFTTAILGDFIAEPEYHNAAVTTYCFGYFIPVPAVLIVFLYASNNHRLVDKKLAKSFINECRLKIITGMVLLGIALGLSFYYPNISLCIIGISFLMYLLPPTPPKYEDGYVEEAGE